MSFHQVASSDAILGPDPWPRRGARAESDRFAFGALLAFLAIFILAPQTLVPALAPLRIALVSAVFALGAFALGRLATSRPLTIAAPEIRLAGALFAWAALSVPFALWRGGAASVLTGLFLRTLIVFWLLCNLVNTADRLRQVALTLSLLAAPLAVTAIVQFLHGAPDGSRIQGYDAPLTSNPNDLALMLNVVLPLTVALALVPDPPLPRVVLGGLAALSGIGVILTFSRAGFLTLAATSLCWLRRLGRNRALEIGLLAVVVVMIAVPLLPSGYVGHLETIANMDSDRTGSAQERWRDMGAATAYALMHPVFGTGIGMNQLALNEVRGATWTMVHNVYLQIAVELGVPGVVLFVLLLRAARRSAREARAAAAAARHRGVEVIADGVAIGLVGFFVASLFHPVAYHAYFYLLAALAVASKALAGGRSAEAAA